MRLKLVHHNGAKWAMPVDRSEPTSDYADDHQAYYLENCVAYFYNGTVFDRASGILEIPCDCEQSDRELLAIAKIVNDLGFRIGL